MSFSRLARAACLAAGSCVVLAGAAPGLAKKAPKPMVAAPPPLAAVPPGIRGFRSAAFGMTKAQVVAAIATDFGGGIRPMESMNAIERTEVVQAPLASLEPGPGAALVTYIFGASSRRLSNINVIWALQGEPTGEQRASALTAATQLAAYFQSSLKPAKVTGLTPVGPNALVMYAAVDDKGSGVQVDVSGVNYASGDTARNASAARGPAVVRISYTLNAANPDVYRIKAGAF